MLFADRLDGKNSWELPTRKKPNVMPISICSLAKVYQKPTERDAHKCY